MPNTDKFEESYWEVAIGKEVFGNQKLPDLILEFDRGKVTEEQIEKVEEFLSNDQFSLDTAVRASQAAVSLFKWVMAVREYYYISRKVEPSRNAYILSEKQKNDADERYQIKLAELKDLEEQLSKQKEEVSTI